MSASPIGDRDEAEHHAPAAAPRPVPAPEANEVFSAVRAVRGGDREAFGRLVELYETRLFALTLMMVRNPSGAEDVTQEAFVRAFTHLHRYDESRPFYPWLATIAVRLALNWLRLHARVVSGEGAALDREHDSAATADTLDRLILDEKGRELWRSVAALPSGERTAVFLYYRQEMKVNDVASALGVTSGTVKTLLFRARRRLRRQIESAARARRKEDLP